MKNVFYNLSFNKTSPKLVKDDTVKVKTPISHWAKKFPSLKAGITRPFIDKLVIRYNLQDLSDPEGGKGVILEQLKFLLKSSDHPEYCSTNIENNGFTMNLTVKPPKSTSRIFIAVKPFKKSVHFLRITLNPSKLSMSDMVWFKKEFSNITNHLSNYETLCNLKGAIADIHITCDIVGIAVDDLEINHAQKKKSLSYESSSGRLESKYYNLSTSESQTYIYNKRRELTDKSKTPMYEGALHSRVERRIDTKACIKSLAGINNPFLKLGIRTANYAEHSKDLNFTHLLFFQAVFSRGLDKTLRLLPDNVKDEYTNLYNETMVDIWEPKKIWSYWSDYIKSSGVLP